MKHTPHTMISARFPGGRRKAATFTLDDGSEQDRWLVATLRKYGLKGTFNLNSGLMPPTEDFDFSTLDRRLFPAADYGQRRMTFDACRELFRGSGMEVATHGYLHADLTFLTEEAVLAEILRDRERLEEMTGAPVRGHAFSQGAYSDRICELLRSCGIAYARIAGASENFAPPADCMKWQPTCHYAAGNTPDLIRAFTEEPDNESPYYGGCYPRFFCIFAHSYELEYHNNYAAMEEDCRLLSGHDGVWYCTNIEYFDYMRAYRRLEYNVACTVVHNPSAVPVWLRANGETLRVPAGETVSLV